MSCGPVPAVARSSLPRCALTRAHRHETDVYLSERCQKRHPEGSTKRSEDRVRQDDQAQRTDALDDLVMGREQLQPSCGKALPREPRCLACFAQNMVEPPANRLDDWRTKEPWAPP